MAAGDVKYFGAFTEDLALGKHDLANDTFNLALIDNTTAPTTGHEEPNFGGTGETDFSSWACTTGGGLTSIGGLDISGVFAFVTGNAGGTQDGSLVSYAQGATGSTEVRYGILYNLTAADKNACGWVVIGDGAAVSLVAGDITVDWHASGIATITVT